MLIHKALGKVEKMLGGNAHEDRWYEAPVYRYTLHKEISELTEEGHGWKWNNDGEAVVYGLTDDEWARATVYPIDGWDIALKAGLTSKGGREKVCSVSGVESVEEEVIGRTEWDITVDVADGLIVDVDRTEIRDGKGRSDRMEEYLESS